MTKGDLYTPLEWECSDGHRFLAKPFTILKAGHWCPQCEGDYVWDFGRLAQKSPFYAQVWYDSHEKDEKEKYYFDSNFSACCESGGVNK